MKEKNHSEEDYSKMTEESWIKNKKAIIKGLAHNGSSLSDFRKELLSEKKSLDGEVESLEQNNFSVLRKAQDLEMQHLEKDDVLQELKLKLHNSKNDLIEPLTEENGYLSEMSFFDDEKERLLEKQDRTAEALNDNMSSLGNTIMEIEFIKGEICTLMDKVGMIEKGLTDLFGEVGELDEKILWASKALRDLYDKMKKVEKDAKTSYYERN